MELIYAGIKKEFELAGITQSLSKELPSADLLLIFKHLLPYTILLVIEKELMVLAECYTILLPSTIDSDDLSRNTK